MIEDKHPFSWPAIFRILITIFSVYFIWRSADTLILIIVSLMLATALTPLVQRLQKYMPMSVATMIVLLILLVPFVAVFAMVIPSFINEFPALLKTVDRLVNSASFLPPTLRNLDLTQYISSGSTYVLKSTGVVTNAITSVITVLFLTFYLIIEATILRKLVVSLVPHPQAKKANNLLNELEIVIGNYIRGNLVISLICGVVVFVGLIMLRVPFAAPLAIFAAVLDLLPLVGSTIAMIPAIIIGFSVSPLVGILVIALYVIYQQVENNLIAPTVYNKALNLSAALGFLSVIIGSSLFGIIGAFLALPVAASIPVFIKYWKEEDKG
jgi:predicted PurR-regulated permease PerM